MKKLHMLIVPFLLTAIATSAQDEDSNFSELGAYFGTSVDILENTADQKNVSLSVQAMVFPDISRVKQFSLYFGGGGSVANTNGVTDTSQTVFGEIGFQTKYVTPYISVFYTTEASSETTEDTPTDAPSDIPEECLIEPDACEDFFAGEPTDIVNLYYGSGMRFGFGVIVNSPVSDNFSAKISSIVDDEFAIDARVFYQIPISGEAKPVISLGYKRVTSENNTLEGLRDGDGFSVSIGISRQL